MTAPRIAGVGLLPLHLPLRQPFVTALGEKWESRNLLVAVRLSNGTTGYGEASASLAWPEETQGSMVKALRPLIPTLMGQPISSFRRRLHRLWQQAGEQPAAASALECALIDAYTRAAGLPLWRWLGGRRRSVTTGITISAWEPEVAARFARRVARAGFRRLKVKVTGRDIDQDLRRLVAVHRVAPRAALWMDGNQGFSALEAIRFCLFLRQQRLPVRLFEQPVPRSDPEGLRRVEMEGLIPVAADESARTVEETLRLLRRRWVSVINVKLAKCGLMGAIQIIGRARAAQRTLMIGCMAESAIGLSHSVALACGSGAFNFVDLDSHLLVVSPRCRPGFSARGARLGVCPTRPGTGVEFPFPGP